MNALAEFNLQWLEQWVHSYGYFAIFALLMTGVVGIPWPDEWLMVFAGYLCCTGELALAWTVLTGVLGSVCGITVSYILGRTLGLGIVHKYGRYLRISQEKLDRGHRWFERWGKWSLTACYFIPGFRHLAAILAGATYLKYRRFAAFAYSGAVLWVVTFVSMGYYAGPHFRELAHLLHRYMVATAIVLGAVVVLYFVGKYLLKRRKERRARSEGRKKEPLQAFLISHEFHAHGNVPHRQQSMSVHPHHRRLDGLAGENVGQTVALGCQPHDLVHLQRDARGNVHQQPPLGVVHAPPDVTLAGAIVRELQAGRLGPPNVPPAIEHRCGTHTHLPTI